MNLSFVIAALLGIDPLLSLYAIVAFTIIGVGLTALILFTKAKLVKTEECQILINDDSSMTIETPGGGTLLSVLTANGIPVPSPCGGKATCKQCRVQITDGAGEPLQTEVDSFTKRQLKNGWRLSCQTKVKHDLHVHVMNTPSQIKEWIATVISNNNVATFIKELVVEIPLGEAVSYQSGGYLSHVPPFKTNTNDWKATMDPIFYPDWEKYSLFGREIDFSSPSYGIPWSDPRLFHGLTPC